MKKVLIVGFGRFGKVLEKILSEDFDVFINEINKEKIKSEKNLKFVDISEGISLCDTIFYSVPISNFEETFLSHKKFFNEKNPKTIIDTCSVKIFPKKILEKNLPKNFESILTHPMFGPDSYEKNKSLPIVLDRFNSSNENYNFWKNFFISKNLKVVEMDADTHDQIASKTQGVTHFIGRILEDFGFEKSEIDTNGAKKLLEIKDQTCNDSWQLFSDLQTKNPYAIEMRKKIGESFDKIYSKLLPNKIFTDRLVIGIQGGPGSFNDEAVRYYLKRSEIENFEIVYLYTSENVLKALTEGKIDRGQFAIHNSTGGIVMESIKAMAKFKFKILEEFAIKISHTLMIHPDVTLEQVDSIMTHNQVFRQCKRTLAEKYPNLKLVDGIDTSLTAKEISEGILPKNFGAMGSKVLAEIYNLKIVEENLQDSDQNFTSFLWIERL